MFCSNILSDFVFLFQAFFVCKCFFFFFCLWNTSEMVSSNFYFSMLFHFVSIDRLGNSFCYHRFLFDVPWIVRSFFESRFKSRHRRCSLRFSNLSSQVRNLESIDVIPLISVFIPSTLKNGQEYLQWILVHRLFIYSFICPCDLLSVSSLIFSEHSKSYSCTFTVNTGVCAAGNQLISSTHYERFYFTLFRWG